MGRRLKPIADQLLDAVEAINDELAKPGDIKPARANLLTCRVDTLKHLHAAEIDALAAENAALKKELAESKATSPQTISQPQSELDATVARMLERHNAQPTPSQTIVTVPTMTRSERLTPAPVEDDEDSLT